MLIKKNNEITFVSTVSLLNKFNLSIHAKTKWAMYYARLFWKH
ncbi:hypothetical protein T643_A4249 [Klebsiella pneumoniae MRSN 1319]|nr:hypothetical protein T643_A4249 [Klebsiella pneumoniae MRSN 1319]